ncbi:MAG: FMN-dependent NADH-azoreductase [Hyphomicrobiales bacterium]
MKLLHIDSGILGEHSVTRRLSAALVDQWRKRQPGLKVTYRDLASNPIGHLSGSYLMAQSVDSARHSPELQRDLAESGKALEEFLDADVVVIGAPMYNFSVPSQLKAWIDRIAVQGKTFRYTEKGPEGLASGKKVIIVSSRGGFYSKENGLAAIDHQEPYLRAVFGFLGITDIEFIRAEGVNVSPQKKQEAIASAEKAITQGEYAKAA